MSDNNYSKFIVSTVLDKLKISVLGTECDVPVCGIANGCVGVMLVFDNRDDANAFSDGAEIFEATVNL